MSNVWFLIEALKNTLEKDEDGDIVLNDLDVAAFRTPLCLVCGQDTLKPDVVFFGESVPKPLVADARKRRRERGGSMLTSSSADHDNPAAAVGLFP